MSNDAKSEFGGMCFAGHDVPRGAFYCPSCGAPAVQAGHQPGSGPTPQAAWNGAAGQAPRASPVGRPHPPKNPPPISAVPLVPPPLDAPQFPGLAPYGSPIPPQSGWGPARRYRPGPAWSGYGSEDAVSRYRRESNGLAIASLAFGALWIFWFGSILAVMFGHVALHQIRRHNRLGERQTGTGAAVVGLLLGYVGLAVLAITIVAGVAN